MLATPTPPLAQLPDGVAEAEPHTDTPDACYRHLFECALDAVLVIDPEHETVLDANPRACELYGFPRAELVGRSLLQLSQNPRRGRAKIAETLATGSCVQFETVQRRKDGVLLDLEVNASRVDWQGKVAILSINRDVTGRKQAERALEESRQLEQLAMRANRMATWHWDARTGRVTGSASMVTLYGLPAGHHDGTGESWLTHVHQEDREAVRRVWQHACRHAAEFECEYRILLPDGTVRWLAATGTAQRAADHSLQGFLGVCWDVTARHEAESELRASRARRAAILDTALDAILMIDGDGRVVEFNPAAERIFGYGRNEAMGRNMVDLIVPEPLREQHQQGLARHMASGRASVLGRRIETRAMRADGTEFPVELAITRIEADGPPLFAGTLRDVSERKQAEQELQRLNGELARRVEELEHSEERYRELFEDAPVSLHEIDCDGLVRRTNRAACGLLGRDPASILGQPVWDLVAPDEREASRRGVLARLDGSEPLTVFERDYVRPDGRRITAEVRESAITGEDGRVVGLRSSLVDVTERCRLERFEQGQRGVLEMVAQNRLLDEVLERLAHVVEDQLPGTRCAFSLLDQGNLRLLAGPSLPAPVREALADRERGPAPAPGGRVVGDGKVMVADIATEPLWEGCRDLVLHHGLQACWWVPLLSAAGEVLGTCALYVGQAREPEPAELALLEKAGRAAALTVAHRQLTDRLAYLAHHDLLTGLPNRLLFQDRVERAIIHARRHRSRIALLYVDLDNFKLVNDTLGHSVGDALLQQVARRLSGCLRETDTLARMGGDEFTFVITDVINAEAAKLAVQRALASFGEPFHVQGHRLLVRASVGVSLYPRDGECAETLQQHADAAMYQAKERAKGTFQFYAPHLSVKASERLALQADLHRALESGEMELEYQPQAALRDGRLSGFEALLRWRHPRLGLLPPAKFIPIAEETGLIVPIGAWVLGQACRQARTWLQEDHPPVRIAVNVSALQFARQDWVPGVLRTLREAQLDPELLELELTESVVMHDPQEAARQMVRLRKAGVRLAIDDFGTGYSSLSYLHRLPLDRLKIDLSFVREIRSGTQDAPLVHAIIALAHGLGVPVTAEGVETPHQLAVLRELGCDEVQGYLIGRPMPAEAAGSMLQRAAGVPVIC